MTIFISNIKSQSIKHYISQIEEIERIMLIYRSALYSNRNPSAHKKYFCDSENRQESDCL